MPGGAVLGLDALGRGGIDLLALEVVVDLLIGQPQLVFIRAAGLPVGAAG